MQITQIKLKNFRAFRDVEMRDIPKFAVIIGANGTGKSTLFQVFGFLRDAMTTNVTTALAKLGGSRGIKEVRSRGTDGDIEIEIKFRLEKSSPLVTYLLGIGEENGRAVINREILRYRRQPRGRPWHYLDFIKGKGTAVTNEIEEVDDEKLLNREEEVLKSPDLAKLANTSVLKQVRIHPSVIIILL